MDFLTFSARDGFFENTEVRITLSLVFLVLAILIKIFFDPNIAKVKIIETLGIYIIALFKLLPILIDIT